jgi:hypothetical protein
MAQAAAVKTLVQGVIGNFLVLAEEVRRLTTATDMPAVVFAGWYGQRNMKCKARRHFDAVSV